MGMSLSTIRSTEATATVEYLGHSMDFGYFPAVITPEFLEAVEAAANDAVKLGEKPDAKGGALDMVGEMLAPMLAWWDLLDDDQNRLGTDPATIRTLPLGLSMAVLKKAQESMRPPEDAS
jgi:hypothetical protein